MSAAVLKRAPGPAWDGEAPPPLAAMTGAQKWRGRLRLALLMIYAGGLILILYVFWKLHLPGHRLLPLRVHHAIRRSIGMRIRMRGERATGPGVILAPNHASWLDIPIVGCIGRLAFVAKADVAGWTVFGTLAKLQDSVFVERERRLKTADQRDEIKSRLAEGETIVLFAEGTSNDGNRVLPFKSSLLSAAENEITGKDGVARPVRVQPVTIAYTRLQGMPMGRSFMPFFAWYGDMDLLPHIWEMLQLGPVDVEVVFHKPLTVAELGSRKALAAEAHRVISATHASLMAGRDPA